MRFRLSPVLAALLCAAPLAAQGPTVSNRVTGAVIRGTVFDSLVSNRPLADAEVWIEGTSLVTRSDTRGAYRFDAVPAGKMVVGFSHPILDSIGVGAPVKSLELVAGSGVTLPLTTPSIATVHQALCGAPRPDKTGLVIGVVRDVDRDTVVAQVEVTAEWNALVLQQGAQPRNATQTARATTDANGRYVLCGVPNDIPIAVRGAYHGRQGGVVQLEMQDRGMALRNLTVSVAELAEPALVPQKPAAVAVAPKADSAAATAAATAPAPAPPGIRGTARLSGRVTGENGVLIREAEVRVIGAAAVAVKTGDDGVYALRTLPAGSQTVEAKALGYAPKRVVTDLKRASANTLDLSLSKAAVVLDEVSVTGFSTLFDRSGFEQRRRAGIGEYITEEDIKKRAAIRVEDVFRGLMSMQLAPVGVGGYSPYFPRAQGGVDVNHICYPRYWLDGNLLAPLDPNDPQLTSNLNVEPTDIRGIEVYPSASFVPPQYQPANANCGVIVIWTKRGAPTKTFDKP